ncbi:MAG: Transglutaminase-like superfamily protein [Acidobacteria bacterium OLB17]|nr:MAG: Transglutaminase-like superfamily protein [Acidobacteria bacterium OLB17]MCZ2390255.1 transglutaminase family protein [Acidobacteriota bacterium]
MKLQLESDRIEDYLGEIPPIIEFSTPKVKETIAAIEAKASTPRERARLAFEFARDEISHSFDTNSEKVTIAAEDAIAQKEGICFAKSHVLAALLRGMNIPAGFCYQRVLRKGTVESGYALHGLNAVYLEDAGWFRLDPRGNKPGVDSQFSTEEEKLAYPIREELGEFDYPHVLTEPLLSVVRAMRETENCKTLFFDRPESM